LLDVNNGRDLKGVVGIDKCSGGVNGL